MPEIPSHKDLIVWQKAMELCEAVYRIAATFPRAETYRMTGQLTGAAISVPANIAEGHARSTARDYGNFIAIAQGSLAEAETYLLLAARLKNVSPQQAGAAMNLVVEVSKMLSALRRRLVPRANNTGR